MTNNLTCKNDSDELRNAPQRQPLSAIENESPLDLTLFLCSESQSPLLKRNQRITGARHVINEQASINCPKRTNLLRGYKALEVNTKMRLTIILNHPTLFPKNYQKD